VPLRFSAWCGLLAPVAFTVAWLLGGLAQPDAYSTIDDSISDLGALTADSPWLYNQIGANLTGLLVVGLALGLWSTVPRRLSGKVGVIALGVMGVGQFFDGLFRLDCQGIDAGCSEASLSWHANAHEIESLFTVLGLLVSVFALARAFKNAQDWHELRAVSLTAGLATIGVFVGLLFVGGGLAVLGALSVWFAWLALVSYRLLTIAREMEPSATGLAPA
jgi:hypothetical membrane protein